MVADGRYTKSALATPEANRYRLAAPLFFWKDTKDFYHPSTVAIGQGRPLIWPVSVGVTPYSFLYGSLWGSETLSVYCTPTTFTTPNYLTITITICLAIFYLAVNFSGVQYLLLDKILLPGQSGFYIRPAWVSRMWAAAFPGSACGRMFIALSILFCTLSIAQIQIK